MFPVVEAFADLISSYEASVLERQPRPSNTRDLHVMTGGGDVGKDCPLLLSSSTARQLLQCGTRIKSP